MGREIASTVYFGYGSNLWLEQMGKRCPTSQYLGVGRLAGYRWIISSRGYANVVEVLASDPAPAAPPSHEAETRYNEEVWGLIFSLRPEDEERLDRNEGVPVAYTKELHHVDFWPESSHQLGSAHSRVTSAPMQVREMLVYIDRKRTDGNHRPHDEYIVRMNNGVRDALHKGVPQEYVDTVLRRWIPEQDPAHAEEKAKQQALAFQDEN